MASNVPLVPAVALAAVAGTITPTLKPVAANGEFVPDAPTVGACNERVPPLSVTGAVLRDEVVVAASVPLLKAMLLNVLLPESVWVFVPVLESDVPIRLPENVGPVCRLLLPSVRAKGTLLESFNVKFALAGQALPGQSC